MGIQQLSHQLPTLFEMVRLCVDEERNAQHDKKRHNKERQRWRAKVIGEGGV